MRLLWIGIGSKPRTTCSIHTNAATINKSSTPGDLIRWNRVNSRRPTVIVAKPVKIVEIVKTYINERTDTSEGNGFNELIITRGKEM